MLDKFGQQLRDLKDQRGEITVVIIIGLIEYFGIGLSSALLIFTSSKRGITFASLVVFGITFGFIIRNITYRKKLLLFAILLVNLLVISFSKIEIMNLLGLNFTGDWRYELPRKRPKDLDNKIGIVLIDEKTKRKLGSDLRNYRRYHGQVIRNLSQKGARVIGVDIAFPFDSGHDSKFAQSIRELDATKVIITNHYDRELAEFVSTNDAIQIAVSEQFSNSKDIRGIGHALVDVDEDCIVRKVPLKEDTLMAFPLLVYLTSVDGRLINTNNKRKIEYKIKENKSHKIPLNEDHIFNINYSKSRFNTISYYDVYVDSIDKKAIEDKMILIGFADKADLHNTPGFPLRKKMYGVQVMANIVGTLMQEAYIRRMSRAFYLVIILLFLTINLVNFIRHEKENPKSKLSFTSYLGQSFLITVVAILAQSIFNVWIDISYPLLSIWVTYSCFHFYISKFSRKTIHKGNQLITSVVF